MVHQVLLKGSDVTGYCLGWEAEQTVSYGARSARIEFTKDVSPEIGDELEIRGSHGSGYAVRFSGVEGTNLIVPSFQFPNAQKFAITFWMKAYPKASYAYEGVVAHPGLFDGTASLTIENPAFAGFFRIFDASGTEHLLVYDGLYDEDSWTFVVVQYTGSRMEIWKNAQLVASRDVSVTLRTPTRDLVLCSHGHGGSGGGIHITMELDDFRLYERDLKPSEILSLYKGYHVGDGLCVWLPFDEGSGSTVADKGGRGRDGTLYGSPPWIEGCPVSTRLYTVFRGVITRIARSLKGKTVLCDALDYTYLLFFRLIFERAYKDRRADEIVKDLIEAYVPGVTTSNVSAFTRRYDRTFDKITVFDAIRSLAEAEDADFWVTASKDLYFKPRSEASQAPVSLSQGSNVLEASYERSDDRLFNWLRLLGGVGYKPMDRDAWTEGSGWAADGETLVYDASVFKAGTQSVRGTIGTDGGSQRFWYPQGKDLGLVIGSAYQKLYFWLRANSLAWTALRLELHRDESNYVYQALSLSARDAWEQKEIPVGVGSQGWATVGSFSWATDPVNYIQIYHALTPYTLIQETGTYYDAVYASQPRVGQRYTVGGDTRVTRVDFFLKRVGSPGGLAYVRIRRRSDDSIVATVGSIDASTISTTGAWYQFSCDALLAADEYRFTFEYAGGDASNYVGVLYRDANVCPGMRGYYTTAWYDWSSTDMTIRIIVTPIRSIWIDELYFYTPQIQVDAQDSESQASYGRRDAFRSDDTVSDAVWAKALADTQVSLYKEPYDRLRVTAVFLPQLEAGQRIAVTVQDFGISNQSFRILALRHRIPEAVTELDLCPVLPLSLEEALARLRRETSDLIRRTA